MKKLLISLAVMLISLVTLGQLSGDMGYFTKNPTSLKKDSFQFQYVGQYTNQNSYVNNQIGRRDYITYSPLNYNLRYGLGKGFEVQTSFTSIVPVSPTDDTRFMNQKRPGDQTLAIKYQLPWDIIRNTKIALLASTDIDLFDNKPREEYPLFNNHRAGILSETKLAKGLTLRTQTLAMYGYIPGLSSGNSYYNWGIETGINLHYQYKKWGIYAGYNYTIPSSSFARSFNSSLDNFQIGLTYNISPRMQFSLNYTGNLYTGSAEFRPFASKVDRIRFGFTINF